MLAESDNAVYLFGGLVRSSSKAAVGDWATGALAAVHADIAFLGSDGFKGLAGPSTLSYEEAEFKKKVIAASTATYTVCDSSKCQSAGLFAYAGWKDVTGLIIDQNIQESAAEDISRETKLILAKN